MDWHARTIQTYDDSAAELAEYFKGVGSRVADVELALKLAGSPQAARVVEIGCGDGRDAEEIVKRVAWYQGFDPSEALLDLARAKVPQGSFVKADALTYEYPQDLDVVYAFASLLHVDKNDFKKACDKAARALRSGGIFYISLKERDQYAEELKKDRFGERMFYYYTPEVVEELSGSAFTTEYEAHQLIGKTEWFTIALKKLSPS